MSDPVQYSKVEADRILRRAAELDGADDGRRLSVDDLRSIAREAGFGRSALERALAEAQDVEEAAALPAPVQRWGLLITHLSAVRSIPVDITSEQLMRAVRLLHPYREGSPNVRLGEGEVTWRDRRGLEFSITPGPGVTEVRVYVSRLMLRRGRWTGWVASAADRLATLLRMVAATDAAASGARPTPRLPGSGRG